jgi:hypothetical protein
MRTQLSIAFVVLAALALQGCGDSGPKTYSVTGTVTFGGQPVEQGSIVFDPVDGLGTSAMGGIQNGSYTAEVPEGEKIVRISAVRTLTEKDQYGEFITESYIPDKYGAESELRKTVKSGEDNKFDFAL